MLLMLLLLLLLMMFLLLLLLATTFPLPLLLVVFVVAAAVAAAFDFIIIVAAAIAFLLLLLFLLLLQHLILNVVVAVSAAAVAKTILLHLFSWQKTASTTPRTSLAPAAGPSLTNPSALPSATGWAYTTMCTTCTGGPSLAQPCRPCGSPPAGGAWSSQGPPSWGPVGGRPTGWGTTTRPGRTSSTPS